MATDSFLERIPLKISAYNHTYMMTAADRIESMKPWLESFPEKSTLLSMEFLDAIEKAPPEGLKPYYAGLSSETGEPIAFFLFQVKYFKANESLRFEDNCDFFCKIHKRFRGLVANLVSFNTLIGGNLLLTGPFGYLIHPKWKEHESLIYQHVVELMQDWLRSKNVDIDVVLVKDFFEDGKILDESTFHPFCIQPNMIMDLDMRWTSFKDYLESIQSKYRIRANRAFRSAGLIKKAELSLNELKLHAQKIFSLYKQTASNAEFNLLDLHPSYFTQLKISLGEKIRFYTYSINEEVVAFYTLIDDGVDYEAHFLGIDETLNKQYQIYLNILFDMVRLSIESCKQRLKFSRTAIEIKSSVGAKAYTMTCYIKHRKVINNTLVPYIMDFLNQKQEYVLRHPFKTPNELIEVNS